MLPGRQKLDSRPRRSGLRMPAWPRWRTCPSPSSATARRSAPSGVSPWSCCRGRSSAWSASRGRARACSGCRSSGLLPERPRPQSRAGHGARTSTWSSDPAGAAPPVRRRAPGRRLPGPDDLAEPDHADRSAGRRGGWIGGGGHPRCSTRSASPTPGGGCRPIPTSCRAACASG